MLGEGETCTGDSARRSGNEFLFQMLAQQNVEVLNEIGTKKVVATCAHCFNTLRNEYPQLGGTYEVVHHTQLLNRLVREGRLTPVAAAGGRAVDHVPRPLLPGPAQQGVRPAARADRGAARVRPSPRCPATPTAASAAAPAAPACGWRSGSASGSTPSAPRRRSRPGPRRSPSAARTAGSCSATGCRRSRPTLERDEQVQVLDVAQLLLRSVRNGAGLRRRLGGPPSGRTDG